MSAAARVPVSQVLQPVMAREATGDRWRLAVPYEYEDPGPGPTRGIRLRIPAGFVWDRASVPRAVRWLVDNDDLREAAPLVHDWIYSHGGRVPPVLTWVWGAIPLAIPTATYTRAEADALFRAMLLADGVVPWKAHAAYAAVRARGGAYWRTPDSAGARVQAILTAREGA